MRIRIFLLVAMLLLGQALGQAEVLLERGSDWRYLKGSQTPGDWRAADFADSTWPSGPAPFRYGDGQGGTVLDDMPRRYSTLYLRRTFEAQNVSQYSVLDLLANFDDGFLVWINGKLVTGANPPRGAASQLASGTHESGRFEAFEISDPGSFLKNGINTIAVQGFNLSLTSSDFLIDVELVGILKDAEPPRLVGFSPKPGQLDQLNRVTLQFSEPVRGIDGSELRLNGEPSIAIDGEGAEWTFQFEEADYGEVALTWEADHGIEDFGRPANPFVPGTKELARYRVVDDVPPTLSEILPPPGATVRELKRLRLFFDEPVNDLRVEDIRINGEAPKGVTGFSTGPWEVEFKKIKGGKVTVSWSGSHGITDRAAKPNAFTGGGWSYTVDPNHWPGSVVINEFVATNQSVLKDEDGQAVDWIELQNTGRNLVNLSGWSLTDDKGRPGRWVFPAVELDAGEFLVVFASGKNRRVAGEPLHTNFKLSSAGGYVGLFSPELPRKTVDKITGYPEQRGNISYGLSATDEPVYFIRPTPGAENGAGSFEEILRRPKFSRKRSFFAEAFELELSSRDAGAVIRYTTDHSLPTQDNGKLYRSPIPISKTTVIRAVAFRRGSWPSRAATHTYVLGDSDAITSLPIMSLVTDRKNLWGETGILEIEPRNTNKRGIAWERQTSAELFFPDGADGFQIESGLRLQGGDYIRSRHTPHGPVPWSKYSFRLYFRGGYGESRLNHQLFPDLPLDEFEHVVLRAGMNDSINPFICDELCRRLYRDLGHASSRGVFVNLLLNGESQAYYNPTERVDINFLRSRHGGGTEWDLIAQFGEIREGDDLEWRRFKSLTIGADLTLQPNYDKAAALIDLDNFIDYIMLCVYVDMDDWPYNNWRAGRERRAGAKWRFYLWDAERSFGTDGKQMLGRHRRVVTSNNLTRGALASRADIARIFQSFAANSEFRLRFADRVQKHYFNGGVLTDENIAQRHRELTEQMQHVLPDMSPHIGQVWIPRRRAIVMEQMASIDLQRSANAPRFSQHGGTVPKDFKLNITTPDGEVRYTIDGTDPRGANAKPYTDPIAFDRHTTVKARTFLDGKWSALTEATFTPEPLGFPVRFTEVMYHPIGGSEYEFVELQNISETEVDLSWHRISGIDFLFRLQAKLGPGERILLTSATEPDALANRYPRLKIYGRYNGTLAKGGEKLVLENPLGQARVTLKYNDKAPWPSAAAGEGHSLQIIDPLANPNDPANWQASPEKGGTPGKKP